MESRNHSNERKQDYTVTVQMEKHRLILHHRYEWLHIINDIMIAIWFLIGSFFFFYESTQTVGTWLFVIGSAQMMVRPIIRIAHKIHVGEIETRNIHF